MKKTRFFFKRILAPIFLGLVVSAISFYVLQTFAAPPDSPYRPGATLSPSCAPGDANCSVSAPLTYDTTNVNVPIGTTTAASLLELYSTSTSPILTITSATSTTTSDPYLSFRTGATPATKFVLGVDYSDSNKFKIATSTIGTNDILTLDQSGNIGVGTSTPAYKLDVWGDLRVNTSSTLGNVISGVWNGTAIADGYISSAGTWNAKQNAITLASSTTGTDFTISSSSATWTFNLPSATSTARGLLASADWTTFNDKQTALGFTPVPDTRNINTTSPLSGGGALTGDLTLSLPTSTASQSGYLSSADWLVFSSKQSQLWGLSGSNLFASSTSWNVGIGTTTPSYKLDVIGDLRVNTSSTLGNVISGVWTGTAIGDTYISSASTWNAKQNAITLASSTTGTDFTISSSSATWTFNLPSATSTARGLLTGADWTSFNNKADPLWLLSGSNLYASTTSWNVGIGTTTPTGLLHLAQGTTTIFYASSTSGNVGIGTASPQAKLDVYDGINSFQGMKTTDEYTKLLLHMDGQASSTTFLDAGTGKVASSTGNAAIDTAQYKFGGASGKFDGTGDYLALADSDDWHFGSGDWTVEGWIRLNGLNTVNASIFFQQTAASNIGAWMGVFSDQNLILRVYSSLSAATPIFTVYASGNPLSADTWYHIAFVHSGSNYLIFKDGNLIKTATDTFSWVNYTDNLEIGHDFVASSDEYFKGWIDELRVSKGIARWTANFMPPTRNYGRIEASDLTITGNVGIGFGTSTGPTANLDVFGGMNSFQGLKTSDDYTKLLLHMDGTDGANASTTSFLDSGKGKTVTTQGNAQIDTAQSKFGGASGLFDGTGDYLTTPDSDDYNFAAGDFSVDFQVRFNSVASNQDFVSHLTDGSSHSWEIFWTTGNTIIFRYATTPTGQVDVTFAWTPSANIWYHIGIVRSGNNLYAFVDGVQVGSTVDFTGITLNNSTGLLYIGMRNDGGRPLNGWLDELRISKGIARWTANFTPPTRNYGRIEASDLIAFGNVSIGTTTPSYLLHVVRADDGNVAGFTDSSGTCTINPTNTALVCSSDLNLKKDIVSFSNSSSSLEKVLALNPISYRWKNQKDETWRFGFVAQEVEQIIPELVFTGSDDSKSLNYLGFAPFLVGAIQEQQKQIEALTSTLIDKVKQILADLGLILEQGIAQVQKLIAGFIQTKELEIGSGETPVGFTIYDKIIKGPYCLSIKNGEWQKAKGKCGNVQEVQPQSVEPDQSSEVEPPTIDTEPPADTAPPVITLVGDSVSNISD